MYPEVKGAWIIKTLLKTSKAVDEGKGQRPENQSHIINTFTSSSSHNCSDKFEILAVTYRTNAQVSFYYVDISFLIRFLINSKKMRVIP